MSTPDPAMEWIVNRMVADFNYYMLWGSLPPTSWWIPNPAPPTAPSPLAGAFLARLLLDWRP